MELSISISTALQIFLFTIALLTALVHIIYKRLLDDISDWKKKIEAIDAKAAVTKTELTTSMHELESHQMAMTANIVEHFVKKTECEKNHE